MTRYSVLGFVLLPAAVFAQGQPPAQLEVMQVTAGRQSESQYQVPQPVTVLTRRSRMSSVACRKRSGVPISSQ